MVKPLSCGYLNAARQDSHSLGRRLGSTYAVPRKERNQPEQTRSLVRKSYKSRRVLGTEAVQISTAPGE